MPFGNGTGPAGMGPMTGRAAGFCAGYRVPGYQNPAGGGRGFGRGYGRGFGRGFGGGFGRGFGRGFGWQRAAGGFAPPAGAGWAPVEPTAEQELNALKSQAEFAENELGEIRKRIAELEAKSES